MQEQDVPPKYRRLYDLARKGPGHPGAARAAIRLKCLECCHFQAEEVRLCSDAGCSLHTFRLMRASEKPVMNAEGVCGNRRRIDERGPGGPKDRPKPERPVTGDSGVFGVTAEIRP